MILQTASDVEKGNRETAEKKQAQYAAMQKAGIKPEKTPDWVGTNSVFFGAHQVCLRPYTHLCACVCRPKCKVMGALASY